jgi:AraC-like DNA-binding protein
MNDREQVLSLAPLLTGHYRWQAGRPDGPQAADPHPYTTMRDGRKLVRRPAGSDDWHLILTLRGQGVAGTVEALHPAPPARALLWRPGAPQCYGVAAGASGWERLWVHVQPPTAWFDLLAWPELEPGLMAVDLPAAACRAVRAALTECIGHDHGGEPDRVRFAMNSLERALLLVAREVARSAAAAPPGRDARIERLVARLGADLAAPWSLPGMAAAAGVSTAQLVRLCARHLGESPHRLLERLRLDQSCLLLERDPAPVARIAAAVGFSDVSHFTRRFRARFTVTPALWRSGRRSGALAARPDPEHLALRPAAPRR